ncbi:MAG: ATP-binding protein [Alphaproteobacteria bacterium]
MPDGMKHSRTDPLPRSSDDIQSDDVSGVSDGIALPNAPPTPEIHAHLEKAVSERFGNPQDLELFMLAIEGSQDGVWDWDIEKDRLYLSARHLEILGYDEPDSIVTPAEWLSMLHPDDVPAYRKALLSCFHGETDNLSTEVRVRRKDGGWSWMFTRGRGIRGADGRVRRMAGMATDVSKRRESESARADAEIRARKAQVHLMDALNVSADGFALFDSDDRLEVFNEQLINVLRDNVISIDRGIAYRDLIAALSESIVLNTIQQEPEDWLARHLDYHESPEGSVIIETAGPRWFNLTERKTHEGGTALMLGDIAPQKLVEQDLQNRVMELQAAKTVSDEQSAELATLAERLVEAKEVADTASRTKSEFLANMSHELRTPLNAIMGFSEVIKNELFGPVGVSQYRQYADDIYDSGAHLLAIINDILDLSKVEAGKFDLNETEIKVPDVCRSVLHIVKGRADEAGITLIKGLPEELPYLVADPRSLKQMLLNLVSNAIKFTDPGGTVDLVVSLCPDGGFRFDVRDTGVGVAPENVEVVLSPFGQIDTAHARDHQGTGLGLPLVQAFIDMHDGRLEIESELGEGTTVSLFFPPDRTRE